MTTAGILPTRQDAMKDEIVRQFAERIDGLTLAPDIAWTAIPYIIDAIVHELQRTNTVVRPMPS